MDLVGVLNVIGGKMKSRQDLIYKVIRNNVEDRMFRYTDDSDYINEVVDYIIEVTKLDELIEALRYIAYSKMWDADEHHFPEDNAGKYWEEKAKILADEAEDALLSLYREIV